MIYHTAFVSVGSNIGDRLANCQNGILVLTNSSVSFLEGQSQFYRTEPVDFKDQDWFVNCAVKIKTNLDPFELLSEIKSIERAAGRKTGAVRFGPRILDMDIILYDDLKIDTSDLKIPHPRMHKRRFVLKPMCDIDPDFIHPVLKKNMKALLCSLDENEQKVYNFT